MTEVSVGVVVGVVVVGRLEEVVVNFGVEAEGEAGSIIEDVVEVLVVL